MSIRGFRTKTGTFQVDFEDGICNKKTFEEVVALANGKCKTYIYDYRSVDDENYKNYQGDDKESKTVLERVLSDIEFVEGLKSGDVFLIRDVGVPDYWWDSDTKTPQIMETQKVIIPSDLSEFNQDADHQLVTDTEKEQWNAVKSKGNQPITLVISNAVPTVDDKSIITFVVKG